MQITHSIDLALDFVRTLTNRVNRWTGPSMEIRWVGTGHSQAKCQFRRAKNRATLPALVALLEGTGGNTAQTLAGTQMVAARI